MNRSNARWSAWTRFSISRTVYVFRVAMWCACLLFALRSPYEFLAVAAAVTILGGGMIFAQWKGYKTVNRYSLLAEMGALTVAIRISGGIESHDFLLYGGLAILLTVYSSFRWSLVGVLTMIGLYGWATGFVWNSDGFWFRIVMLGLFVLGAAAVGTSYVRRERRVREVHRRLELLEGLRLIQEGLLKEAPIEVILDALVGQSVSMLGAEAGYIAVPDPSGRLRVTAAAAGPETDRLLRWEVGAVVAHRRIATTGERLVLTGEDAVREEMPEAQEWGWRALAVAPIKDGRQMMGVLGLGFRDAALVAGDDIRLIDSLAALAAGQMRYDAQRAAARKRGRLLTTLEHVGKLVNSNLRMETLLPVLHQTVAEELQTDGFFVLLTVADDPRKGYMAYLYDDGVGYDPTIVPLKPNSPTMQVLTTGEAQIWVGNPDDASTIGSERSVQGMMMAPLSRESRVIGVISTQSYRAAFDADHLEFLSAVANQAAIAIENAQLYQHAEEVAMTDNMTGLGNARRLEAVGDDVVRQARERSLPLSVLLIDSDSLKAVNDKYGHRAGDAHLQHLARTIRQCVRAGDHAFRYAGDEFVVVLVDTPAQQAVKVAERIRTGVADGFEWEGRHISGISISVGVTELSPDDQGDTSMETLFSRADALMYEAKMGGKNRVTVGA